MNATTRSIKQKVKLEEWKALITEQRESGMTIAKFCASKNICDKSFYRYQKKIRESLIAENEELISSLTLPADHKEDQKPAVSCSKDQSLPLLPAAEYGDFGVIDVSCLQGNQVNEPVPADSGVSLLNTVSTDQSSFQSPVMAADPAIVINASGYSISISNHARPELIKCVMEVLI